MHACVCVCVCACVCACVRVYVYVYVVNGDEVLAINKIKQIWEYYPSLDYTPTPHSSSIQHCYLSFFNTGFKLQLKRFFALLLISLGPYLGEKSSQPKN